MRKPYRWQADCPGRLIQYLRVPKQIPPWIATATRRSEASALPDTRAGLAATLGRAAQSKFAMKEETYERPALRTPVVAPPPDTHRWRRRDCGSLRTVAAVRSSRRNTR